jgi:hypothetical protein
MLHEKQRQHIIFILVLSNGSPKFIGSSPEFIFEGNISLGRSLCYIGYMGISANIANPAGAVTSMLPIFNSNDEMNDLWPIIFFHYSLLTFVFQYHNERRQDCKLARMPECNSTDDFSLTVHHNAIIQP